MSAPKASEEPASRPSFLKRWATPIKLVFGLALVLFIASRLSLDDQVWIAGEETPLEGRNLDLDGELVVTLADGTEKRWPLDASERPLLYVEGERTRVRLPDSEALVDAHYTLVGRATIDLEAGPREIPLAELAFRDGPKDGELVERLIGVEEGLVTIFGRLSLGRYLLAMALVFGMYLCGVIRWWMLLHAQGLMVSFGEAFRLTFIGFFFNNVIPGMTGGDLVKGIIIARKHHGRGAAAVSTVIVDRVVGLLVLAMISAVLLLFYFDRYRTIAIWLYGFLGIAAIGIGLFLSRRVRRTLQLHRLLAKLPMADVLKRLDEAFLLYRSRPRALVWAVLLSLGSHMCNIIAIWLMGTGLGLDNSAGLEGEPLVTYMVTVPIILIVSSVPLLPAGWGIGELMYGFFFRTVGVTNLGLSVGLSALTRVSTMLWSLLGGVFFMMSRAETQEAVEEVREHEAAGTAG